jgi:signal transduction histidine kinase
MNLKEAQKQKTYNAEKNIAYIRALVILLGTATFFFLDNPYIHRALAYILLLIIWIYGSYVLFYKPYIKYPVFLRSWFTYSGDAVLATLWLYATGGFYSPYYVMFYTSIVAVAFRFNLKTTLFTASLYSVCYFSLVYFMGHIAEHSMVLIVRAGFIFLLGMLAELMSRETLKQTHEKLSMEIMVKEAEMASKEMELQQQKLNQLNEELKRSNLDLQQFTSIASHDLRSPLRKIQIFIDRIEVLDEEGKKFQNKIKLAADNMSLLIADLLKFAKVGFREDIIFEEIDLNVMTDSLLEDLKAAHPERNIQVTKNQLPVIRGVSSQIRQLFQNLLSNAFKFGRSGIVQELAILATTIKGKEFLTDMPDSNEQDFYKISFEDNGVGFDPKFQNKIFAIFQRLHTAEEFEGTGIGLAICKRIIDRHNGYIEASGRPGLGATFTIYLPKARI